MMAIPSAASQKPVVAPQRHLQWTNDGGIPSEHAHQFHNQFHAFAGNSTRNISTNCSNVGNVYTLTIPGQGPLVQRYNDYDVYIFAASAASTGLVTGGVVTANGTALAVLPFYKNNGAAQATNGDIVLNSVYLAIFADHLNGGNGGFVIK